MGAWAIFFGRKGGVEVVVIGCRRRKSFMMCLLRGWLVGGRIDALNVGILGFVCLIVCGF